MTEPTPTEPVQEPTEAPYEWEPLPNHHLLWKGDELIAHVRLRDRKEVQSDKGPTTRRAGWYWSRARESIEIGPYKTAIQARADVDKTLQTGLDTATEQPLPATDFQVVAFSIAYDQFLKTQDFNRARGFLSIVPEILERMRVDDVIVKKVAEMPPELAGEALTSLITERATRIEQQERKLASVKRDTYTTQPPPNTDPPGRGDQGGEAPGRVR